MAERDQSFLERWARRKAEPEPAEPAPEAVPAPTDETGAAGTAGALDAEEEARRQALIESLPDIDSMEQGADFSVFLQKGVPEALQRRALRKLWRLNPLFADLDGLNDYDEDFNDVALLVDGVKTLFQVGKGMADRTAPAEAAGSEQAASEATGAPADETAEAEGEAAPTAPEAVEPAEQAALEAAEPSVPVESTVSVPSEVRPTKAVEPPTPAETEPALGAAAALVRGSGRPALARRWGLPET